MYIATCSDLCVFLCGSHLNGIGFWWNIWRCIAQRGDLSSGAFLVNICLNVLEVRCGYYVYLCVCHGVADVGTPWCAAFKWKQSGWDVYHHEEYPQVHSKNLLPSCMQRRGGCCGRVFSRDIIWRRPIDSLPESRCSSSPDIAVEHLDGVTPVTEDWDARLTLMRVWCLVSM